MQLPDALILDIIKRITPFITRLELTCHASALHLLPEKIRGRWILHFSLCGWLRKLITPSQPFRYKTETIFDSVTWIFLRFRQWCCEISSAPCGIPFWCDWCGDYCIEMHFMAFRWSNYANAMFLNLLQQTLSLKCFIVLSSVRKEGADPFSRLNLCNYSGKCSSLWVCLAFFYKFATKTFFLLSHKKWTTTTPWLSMREPTP